MDTYIFRKMAYEGLGGILIWKLGVFPRKIYLDSVLGKDLGLDAVDMEDLAAAVEEKFKISRNETARILTPQIKIESFVEFIAGKLRDFAEKKLDK